MARKIIGLCVLLMLVCPASAQTALQAGSPPPPLELADLKGAPVSLNSYLENKAVILSFFASFSKSCREEVSFLQELSEKYSAKGLKVIGISFDRKASHLSSFLKENKVTYTVLHDKKLKSLDDYRILILPTLFVIDRSGKISNIYVDFDDNVKKALSKEIHEMLNPPKRS